MTDQSKATFATLEEPYIPGDFKAMLPLLKRCRQRNIPLRLKPQEVVTIVAGVSMRYNWFGQKPESAISDVLAIVHWKHQKARVKQVCAELLGWIEEGCKDTVSDA